MKANKHFSDDLLTALQKSLGLRIRAGTGAHRFIGIWFVVAEGRVFVRSWSLKPDGWYRTFLKQPRGAIQVGKSEIAVRAKPVRGERLRSAVDRAYLAKYNTKGAIKVYECPLLDGRNRQRTIPPPANPKTPRQSKGLTVYRVGRPPAVKPPGISGAPSGVLVGTHDAPPASSAV